MITQYKITTFFFKKHLFYNSSLDMALFQFSCYLDDKDYFNIKTSTLF